MDPAVFAITCSGLIYILAVYVDECILFGRNGPLFTNFKTTFSARVDLEDLAPIAWLLGYIERDSARRILTPTCPRATLGSLTPIAAKQASTDFLNSSLDIKTFPFSTLIGKILYCATMVRPKIFVAGSLLNRHQSSTNGGPNEQAKRVLR